MKNILFIIAIIFSIHSEAGPGYGTGVGNGGGSGGGGTKPTNSYGGVDIVKPSTVKPKPNMSQNDGMAVLIERLRQESADSGAVRYRGTDRSEVLFEIAPSSGDAFGTIQSRKRVEEFKPTEAEFLNALRKSKSLGGQWIELPADLIKAQ